MRKRREPPEPAELPAEIWDVQQACNFLKVGRTKLYELIDAGLPSVKICGSRRFDPRDVGRWWQQQKESA